MFVDNMCNTLGEMGYDLLAYIDVDQYEVETIVTENNLDRKDWEAGSLIVEKYQQAHPAIDWDLHYWFNES